MKQAWARVKPKRPGPACSVCSDKRRALIERACDERGVIAAASKYEIAKTTLAKHWSKHPRLKTAKRGATVPPPAALRAATGASEKAPELATLGANATELERVSSHCDWLAAMIRWETDTNEKARLSSALMTWIKLQAKLSGATDLSMQTLIRSPHWIKLYSTVADELAKFPEALAAVRRALEILTTGEETTVADRSGA